MATKKRADVRWNDETERLLSAASKACGVSKAQFIREAILMRSLLVIEEDLPTEGAEIVARLRAISNEVRRLSTP